ncbi:hypothetical protein PENTCL1PPCAC_11839, partial [Pristionchus entomophagus]
MRLLASLILLTLLLVESDALLSNKDKIACLATAMNLMDKEPDKVLKKKIEQTLETITDIGLEVLGMSDEQIDRIVNYYFTGQCSDMKSFFACVSPLSAKLEAETDEELKTAINAGLAKYMEGDEEEAKAIVKALSEEQSTRYRDFYLVDEMLRGTVLVLFSVAAAIALTPEEEACVAPISAKLEAEKDDALKGIISTGLGQFTEGKMEEAKETMKGLTEEQTSRFRDFYLVDEKVLSPFDKACVAPISAKLEAEKDDALKGIISTGLGQFTV